MAINKDFIIPDAGLQVNGATVVSSTLGVNGAVTVANTLAVGNTTITGNVNVTVAANVGGAIRAGGLITGTAGLDVTGTANASVAINVGANVNLSATSINVGNSSVNTAVTSSSVRTGNTSAYTNVTPTEIRTTGLISVAGNATFSNAVAVTGNAIFSNTLSVTGAATFLNNVTVSGDFTVSGTTTYVNTATLNIADNIITLNSDVSSLTAPSENAGIEINRGSSANVQVRWNETTDKWQITTDGTNYGDIHSKLADVALGTDTSGNYVATLSSANGVGGSGTGEGSAPSLYAIGANGITVTTAGINVQAGTELTSNTSGIHHNDITRTNSTTGNTSPNYGGTFTAVDSITTNARGHVTAVNTKTVTMPSSNNTTYDLAAVANTAANEGKFNLVGSDATTDTVKVSGVSDLTASSNATHVILTHDDISRSNTTSSASPNYAGTFTAVDSITTNARGHVTAVNTKTVTMPSSNNTTYDLGAAANTAANEGKINLTGSDSTTDTVKVSGANDITASSNASHVILTHDDIARANNTSTASPASGGTFTAIDSITTNARGHVTAINTKTVTLPVDPNTTYTSASVANTAANQGLARLTSSSNANTDVSFVGQDEITVTSNSTAIYIDHNDISRTDTTNGNTSPNYAGTFTAVDSITTNARGHITAVNTKTVTMPSSNNTTYISSSVANTAANEGRIRLTSSGNVNTDVLVVGQGDVKVTSNATALYINSISYGLGTTANDAINLGYIALERAGTTSITANVVGLDEITISSNSTAIYVDHNDVARSNNTSTASPASGGTFTAIDSITTNARGHVTAINTKTVTLPVDPNTTYTSATVANTAANQGRIRLTSSDNVNTDVLIVGDTDITVTSNSTAIYIDHNLVTRTNNTSTASPASGGTFTAIDSITTSPEGHITAVNTKTVTLPVDPNTTYTGANGIALNGTQFYANVGATLVANASGIHLPAVASAGSSTGGISAITIDAQGRVTAVTGSAGYVTSSGVTSVASGSGLTGGPITTTGTLSVLANSGIVANSSGVFHADTSSQTSVNNSGTTFIQDITLDTYGHITAITSASVTQSVTAYAAARFYAVYNPGSTYVPGTWTGYTAGLKNVSSVTINSFGNYTFNFTTAFADANYKAVFTPGVSSTSATAAYVAVVSQATGSVQVVTKYTGNSSGGQFAFDPSNYINMIALEF